MEDRGGESKFDFPIFLLVLGVWGEGSEIRGNSRLEGVCMGLGSKVWERTQRMEKKQNGLPHPSGFSYNTAPEIGRKLGMTLRMCMPEQGMPSVTPPNLLCVLCASALDPSAHWGVPGSLSILLAYCFQRVPKPPPRRGSYVDDSPKPNFLSPPRKRGAIHGPPCSFWGSSQFSSFRPSENTFLPWHVSTAS